MNVWVKGIVFLAAFVVFHFAYELTGWGFLKPFCGVNESVYQHLKMAFWGYLATDAVEYLLGRRKPSGNFWFAGLAGATMAPYLVMLFWYLGPAFFGRFGSLAGDLLWAIFATYTGGMSAIVLEDSLAKTTPTKTAKAFVIAAAVVSAFSFIWFTYKLPWVDLFIDPETIPR
ncbi:MAG TPA: hypothetical protein ENG11_04365 [candidate division Zixibacteria bacterium]|nr:hypothetical protein [candidate division Zixibacteria bacterium]